MSFPPGNEMFQFPGFASYTYVFSARYSLRSGFPHSEIRGSTIARISPRLIAACHVLHRLLAPRHPPNALFLLILTTTVRAQDQTAPSELSSTRPIRSHKGTATAHSTQITHTLDEDTNHPSPELPLRTAAADLHPPNHLHRLKEHAHPRTKVLDRKLLREVGTALQPHRLHENIAQPGAPANCKPRNQRPRPPATCYGG